jgi:poly(A) polymerase
VEPSILERAEHPISRRDIDANVLKVLYRLINANHVACLVGGSVRDLMMGRRPKDFDVATSAHPHEVRDLFRNSRLIGRRFRLVHVFFGPQNIEVATFRQRSEDLIDNDDPMIRHDNTFGSPEEDAFRRDFTVNSLFYDPRTFRVIDYAGGVPDLHAHLIRSIGDPEVRMREDPVRMIRAVRFAAKLDFEIEPATRDAIERHSGDLAKASVPRLVEETFRTLSLAGAPRALVLMEQLGLLQMLLPTVSEHLRLYAGDLESARTVRNLTALGEAIRTGFEPSRPFILACLLADRHLTIANTAAPSHGLDLAGALRACGFSRADTEHMRLLLDALTHMITPSRLTRRLLRRPYFAHARHLFEMIAPSINADVAALDLFLSTPREHPPARRPRRYLPRATHSGPADTGANGPRRRRRRRHGGGRGRPSAMNRLAETDTANVAIAPATSLPEQTAASGESAAAPELARKVPAPTGIVRD